MTFTQKLFSFEGRLRRQDFWICTLVLWAISWVACIVVFMVMGGGMMSAMTAAQTGDPNDPAVAAAMLRAMGPMYAVLAVFWLAMLWPQLAVSVKRLHDRDQSGWLILLMLIPLVNFFFWLINLGILDGTPGPNRFGPSPKGLGETALAI